MKNMIPLQTQHPGGYREYNRLPSAIVRLFRTVIMVMLTGQSPVGSFHPAKRRK
jgi:hypothetical protein